MRVGKTLLSTGLSDTTIHERTLGKSLSRISYLPGPGGTHVRGGPPAFIVASRVELRTRKHGTPASAATLWSSAGEGSYAVESCVKDQPGTEITIRFAVWDAQDQILDSTSVLDNFRWIANGGTVEIGTGETPGVPN